MNYSLILSSLLLGSTPKSTGQPKESANLKLWYQQPASNRMREALPIGNGYLAAMFFGGIEEDRIQFNEESLWSGGRGEWEAYNGGNRPGAYISITLWTPIHKQCIISRPALLLTWGDGNPDEILRAQGCFTCPDSYAV